MSKGVARGQGRGRLDRCLGVDADLLAVLSGVLEADLSADEREQGVIAPHANVVARLDSRASLTNDDRAGQHGLTVAALDTKSLASAIATVSGAAHSLLMC